MPHRVIRVASNIPGLRQAICQQETPEYEYKYIDTSHGGVFRFIRQCLRADLVLHDDDVRRLLLACVLRPVIGYCLVSVDPVLRRPKTMKACCMALLKRVLFSRVDAFILYFKDLRGYDRLYGIGPARAAYVPFKVNGWKLASSSPSAGSFVLCAGRSRRDVRTFVQAMRKTGHPGVLLEQRAELLAQHGTSAWADELPPNLKLIVDEGDSLRNLPPMSSPMRGWSNLGGLIDRAGNLPSAGGITWLVAKLRGSGWRHLRSG
jgi:hypothetical protein